MKNVIFALTGLVVLLLLQSCVKSEQDNETSIPLYFYKDQIVEQQIKDIRLGDGTPITLNITYRWGLNDVDTFIRSFNDPMSFDSLILQPRAKEIADITSVKFLSIDSVFTSKREDYINTVRQELMFGLGGNEANVKEVIITNLVFPSKYTRALEDISLKKKEIERIRQQSLVDLEQSVANKKKATSDGLVQIAQAEAHGRLEKIKAGTEESRRASQLALAETESQVAEIRAQAEARKKQIAAMTDLEKNRKSLELQRQDLEARNTLAISNQKKLNTMSLAQDKSSREQDMLLTKQQREFEFDMEMTFAQLCTEKPLYADYLVNKELASHVEIAILPTGAKMGVFENVIKNKMGRNVQ